MSYCSCNLLQKPHNDTVGQRFGFTDILESVLAFFFHS